jgi:hypothetical protein
MMEAVDVPAAQMDDFVPVAGNGSVSRVNELAPLVATSSHVWGGVTAKHFPEVRFPGGMSTVSCEDRHKAAQA